MLVPGWYYPVDIFGLIAGYGCREFGYLQGAIADYNDAVPGVENALYDTLPAQSTSWWNLTGFRKGNLLRIDNDVLVANGQQTLSMTGGFLAQGQGLDSLLASPLSMRVYSRSWAKWCSQRVSDGIAGGLQPGQQAIASASQAHAQRTVAEAQLAELDERSNSAFTLLGPTSDTVIQLGASRQAAAEVLAAAQAQCEVLENTAEVTIRTCLSVIKGKLNDENTYLTAQLAVETAPVRQKQLQRTITALTGWQTAVMQSESQLAQNTTDYELHVAAVSSMHGGLRKYIDAAADCTAVDTAQPSPGEIVVIGHRVIATGPNATLSQTLQVNLDLSNDAIADIYDVDVKYGVVHAYPDELSQQYAGAK